MAINLAQSDQQIAKDLGIDPNNPDQLGGLTLQQKLAGATGAGSLENYFIQKGVAALNAGAKIVPYMGWDSSSGETIQAWRNALVFPDGSQYDASEFGINRIVDRGNGAYQLAFTAPGGGDFLIDANPNKATGNLSVDPKSVQIDTGESSGFGGFLDKYGMNIALTAMGAGPLLAAANTVSALTSGADPLTVAKNAAASYVGSQVGSEVGADTGYSSLGSAAGTTTSGLLSGQDFNTALTNGLISGAGTGIANTVNATPSATKGKDYTAGADYSAPSTGGGLGLKASMGEGTDLFGNLSGGDGLNALKALFGGANLFSMGGGQGLTIPSSTGSGTLGANGVGNAWGVNSGTSTSTPLDANNAIASGGNVVGAGTVTSLLKSLFGGSSGTGTKNMTANTTNLGNLLGGLLGGAGGLMQGSTNADAMKEYANAITQAGNKAQAQAAFRPVGMTTSFGTSNFTIDPTTGQITNAGYSLSPQLQAAQEGVLGGLRQNLTDANTQAALGRSYLGLNPQDVASNWLSQQQALLAPSRDTAWARLNQGNYNRGTTGLKVAQGGNLQAANPYASALANAEAQQNLLLASQAQQQGQNAVTFGQGLLSSAYAPVNAGLTTSKAIEALGQNPYGLSTDLANMVSQRGAVTGGLGLNAASSAAKAMQQANTYNPWAEAMMNVGGSQMGSNVLGGLLGNTSFGKSLGNWLGGLTGYDYGGTPQGAYGLQDAYMASLPNLNTEQANILNEQNSWFNTPDWTSNVTDPETRLALGLD